MSDQDGRQAIAMPRPSTEDAKAWKAYWQAQGQPWRTEPEIDTERQEELASRCTIVPDIEKGIYPFEGVKLSRADMEWLLVTHEKGRGPINWGDENQRERKGLDLRGANLSQEDLSRLPLACVQCGLTPIEWRDATQEQRNRAAVHMEEANLIMA
jgi:hypothetical protein